MYGAASLPLGTPVELEVISPPPLVNDFRGGGIKALRAMFGRLASNSNCFPTMAENS
jgi:hypothetical protein